MANLRDEQYILSIKKRYEKGFNKNKLEVENDNIMKAKIQKIRNISFAIEGGMLAYFVTGFFISVLWYGYFWMFTSLWVISKNISKTFMEEIKNMK